MISENITLGPSQLRWAFRPPSSPCKPSSLRGTNVPPPEKFLLLSDFYAQSCEILLSLTLLSSLVLFMGIFSFENLRLSSGENSRSSVPVFPANALDRKALFIAAQVFEAAIFSQILFSWFFLFVGMPSSSNMPWMIGSWGREAWLINSEVHFLGANIGLLLAIHCNYTSWTIGHTLMDYTNYHCGECFY